MAHTTHGSKTRISSYLLCESCSAEPQPGVVSVCRRASAQVVSFADSLRDGEGRPLVRSARIASSLPLPQEVPDIVVATPAGLMGATTDLGPYAGWEWTKAGIVSRCSPGRCTAAWLLSADGTQAAIGLQSDDKSHASSAVAVLS